MKILEIITPSRIGGAETYTTRVVKRLIEIGNEVEIFCPAGRMYIDYLERNGLKPVIWKTYGKIDPLMVIRLVKLMHKEKFDIVHCNLSTASTLGGIAARIAGIPSVANINGFNSALFYKTVDRVVAVSRAVRQHIINQGFNKDKIEVIYNGIDISQYNPISQMEAKSITGLNPDRRYIGQIGRLSPEKGPMQFMDVFKLAAKAIPDVDFLVVGDGVLKPKLEHRAAELNIENRVIFTGFQDDVKPYESACDIIAAPSLKEGCSITVLESMALARPVVASRVGGLVEQIDSGDTGYLIGPGDTQEYAEKLIYLLNNPELAEQFGVNAREKAVREFNFNDIVNQFQNLMQSMVKE